MEHRSLAGFALGTTVTTRSKRTPQAAPIVNGISVIIGIDRKWLTFLLLIALLGYQMEEDVNLPHGIEVKSPLEKMKADKKFTEDLSIGYPGAPDEKTRIVAQLVIDNALGKLINASDAPIRETKFWSILQVAAMELVDMGSEEMDQGLTYMEEIMDIYGIESSGGRLSTWRYGFDPEAR